MKAAMALFLVLAAGLPTTTNARAADYLDDRSDAKTLVRSLYNAINRKEYARAYGYFAEPPADNVEAYAEGFENTESVELLTGASAEEGAAGSVFTTLPVAIRAAMSDGGEKVFAGCYTTRLANPQTQADSFKPLMIEEGALEPADGPLEAALPASCGDAPPVPPADTAMDEARAQFDAIYRQTCRMPEEAVEEAGREPESFVIPFKYASDPSEGPEREARLFRFWCTTGAYNEIHVYFLADETGEVTPLHFATPELSIHYMNEDPEGEVDDMRIAGYTAQDRLVNSQYDPETLTIRSTAKWRGAGDASANGVWIFRDGRFTLVKYDVDPTYDQEINPQPMLDFYSGP